MCYAFFSMFWLCDNFQVGIILVLMLFSLHILHVFYALVFYIFDFELVVGASTYFLGAGGRCLGEDAERSNFQLSRYNTLQK